MMRRILGRTALLVLLVFPATAAAEPPASSDVVVGYQSKRATRAQPKRIEVERQVIRGRAQKPHIVFHVKKAPLSFEVGTSRYSWRAEERRRANHGRH